MADKEKKHSSAVHAKNSKPEAKNMFKAFSAVKVPSLPDINQAMDMQKQQMAMLKEAQAVLSEMMKDISGMNMAYMQKNAQEMQAVMKSFVDQLTVSGESMKQESIKAFNQKVEELKEHHSKAVAKVKESSAEHAKMLKEKHQSVEDSKLNFMNMMQSHIDKSKERHAHLHKKWKQVTSEMHSKFKAKSEEAKSHHKGTADVWKESTKRIMDLMKSTTANHSKRA